MSLGVEYHRRSHVLVGVRDETTREGGGNHGWAMTMGNETSRHGDASCNDILMLHE